MKIKDTWNTSRRGLNMKNPFSKRNPCLNCFSALCGPLPPSFLNLRAVVAPDNDIMITTPRNNNTDETRRYQMDENGYYTDHVMLLFN
jgi:hypothetical protein